MDPDSANVGIVPSCRCLPALFQMVYKKCRCFDSSIRMVRPLIGHLSVDPSTDMSARRLTLPESIRPIRF